MLGAAIVAMAWTLASAEPTEISKAGMTPTVSSASEGDASKTIDGLFAATDPHWSAADSGVAWLRLDLGSRYTLQQFDYIPRQGTYRQYACIKDYEIYVTDSTSANPADWGPFAASGQWANSDPRKSVVITGPQSGRYVILYALTNYGRAGALEVWAYGEPAPPGPVITAFSVMDQSTESNTLTDSPTVTVLDFTAVPQGSPIAGYMITDIPKGDPVPDPPALDDARWSADPPFAYTITTDTGTQGLDVSLLGWVKDANGQISVKMTSIFCNPNVPVDLDVSVTPNSTVMATVSWTTDTETFSRASYRPQGSDTWIETPWETTHGSSHSRHLTQMTTGTTYEIMLEDNETVQDPFTYDHFPELPEIPKSQISVTTSGDFLQGEGTGAVTIDGMWSGDSPCWSTPEPGWLRLNFGDGYAVQQMAYQARTDLGVAIPLH